MSRSSLVASSKAAAGRRGPRRRTWPCDCTGRSKDNDYQTDQNGSSRSQSAVVVGWTAPPEHGRHCAGRWPRRVRNPPRAVHAWTFGYIGGTVQGWPYWGASIGSYTSLGVDLAELHRAAEDLLERAIADVGIESEGVEIERQVVQGPAAEVLVQTASPTISSSSDLGGTGASPASCSALSASNASITRSLRSSSSTRPRQRRPRARRPPAHRLRRRPDPATRTDERTNSTQRREVIEVTAAQDRSGSREGQQGSARVVWSGDLKSGTGALHFEQGAGGELPLLLAGKQRVRAGCDDSGGTHGRRPRGLFHDDARVHARTRWASDRTITTSAQATFGVVDGVQVVRRSELEIAVDADRIGRVAAQPGGRPRRTLLPGLEHAAVRRRRARCRCARPDSPDT